MTLDERELQILRLVARGLTNAQIAAQVGGVKPSYISHPRGPLVSIYRKLGVHGLPASCVRAAAVAEGFRAGLLT